MGSPLTLTVPLPPNLANSRMHWRVKLNRKKAYWELLDMLKSAGALPRVPHDLPPTKTRVAATLYLFAPMDDDNAMARVKWILDWFVKNAYLRGDSRKHIEWAGIPHQVIDRKNPRVELVLTHGVPVIRSRPLRRGDEK